MLTITKRMKVVSLASPTLGKEFHSRPYIMQASWRRGSGFLVLPKQARTYVRWYECMSAVYGPQNISDVRMCSFVCRSGQF